MYPPNQNLAPRIIKNGVLLFSKNHFKPVCITSSSSILFLARKIFWKFSTKEETRSFDFFVYDSTHSVRQWDAIDKNKHFVVKKSCDSSLFRQLRAFDVWAGQDACRFLMCYAVFSHFS